MHPAAAPAAAAAPQATTPPTVVAWAASPGLHALPPCMGGWCTRRDKCARHWLRLGFVPARERLCPAGGHELFLPHGTPAEGAAA